VEEKMDTTNNNDEGIFNSPKNSLGNKKKKILTIIMVLILLGTAFFSLSIIGITTTSFLYEVKINPDENIEYTIIVPFPNMTENADYWQQYIFDRLINSESVDLELVETDHGLGLQIIFNRPIVLEFSKKISIPVNGVTMEESNETYNDGTYNYWIYGNYSQNTSSNLHAELTMRSYIKNEKIFGYRSGSGISVYIYLLEINPSINGGWGKYEGIREHPVG
jgi:hypothetical protein